MELDQMDSVKFVWAYLLKEGIVTNGKWSYYGSSWENVGQQDWRNIDRDMNILRSEVKSIGIDWTKTSNPESSTNNCFDGTFVESSKTETLLGTLVLKNGKTYKVGLKDAELRFSNYAKALVDLMKDRQMVKEMIGE